MGTKLIFLDSACDLQLQITLATGTSGWRCAYPAYLFCTRPTRRGLRLSGLRVAAPKSRVLISPLVDSSPSFL